MSTTFNLPILPLPNIVFFPHTALPMIIIEPSYIKMVRDCIASDGSLVISMAEPIGSSEEAQHYTPQAIATMGKPMMLEELEDGAIKVLITGQHRVELMAVEQNLPYLIYKVRLLPDIKETKLMELEGPQIERLRSLLNSWIDDSIDDSLERESFLESLDSLHHLIDYVSMYLISDRSMKQIVLENRSLHDRIQQLHSLLRGSYPDCEDSLVAIAMKDFESVELRSKLVH
jgi:Lon protease-like protein